MSDKKTNSTSEEQKDGLSRREFTSAVATVAAVSAVPLTACSSIPKTIPVQVPLKEAPSTPNPEKLDYFDRYRNTWTWGGVQKGTHHNNCGLQAQCSFNVYTRDGDVVREEQSANYPQIDPKISDFNPRGCQKGCGYSKFMTNEARLKKPLKRVGERGAGQWEEVSWDDALTDIATKMVDTLEKRPSDGIVIDSAPNAWYGSSQMIGLLRFWQTFDAVFLDVGGSSGDDQQGFHVTYGEYTGGRSADDYFYSDLIYIWNGNPAYTQIPLFHFVTEARYNGAKIISIAPDMNASAMHADLWINVKPGTDAALALGMAQEIIRSNKFDAELLREQTDMPALVRVDTGKMLTQSDLKKKGSKEPVYYYDLTHQEVVLMDVDTLELDDRVPALEGTFDVETLEGIVQVRPVFEVLKENLKMYSLEASSEICGIAPKMIKTLAHQLADAKAATNVANTAQNKSHHGDIITRSQILVFTLAGHMGRHGAGFDAMLAFFTDGVFPVVKDIEITKEYWWDLLKQYGSGMLKDVVTGKNMTRSVTRVMRQAAMDLGIFTNAMLFYYMHTDHMDGQGKPWDENYTRDIEDYVKDAMDLGSFTVEPDPSTPPSMYFNIAGNPLRHLRLGNRMRDIMFPKVEMIVTVDLRLSSTAMHSDYVLPAKGSYEFDDLMICQYSPYIHATTKATTVGEGKGEWELLQLLTKKVQEIAIERQVKHFTTRHGKKRRLDRVYDQISMKGRLNENDGRKVAKVVVENSSNMGDISFEEFQEKGYVRADGMGASPIVEGQAGDVLPDEPMYPYSHHLEHKEPWLTRSGRMQFYVDHDWFIEAKEELPVHKAPPKVGGDHPITMTGGHNRWSIHAQQRTDPMLLRLQRGEPSMWVSVEDAETRGVKDNDRIRVFNDIGSFVTKCRIAPQTGPGQMVMYHAWETFQFENHEANRTVMDSKIKPVELVRDYPMFSALFGSMQPGMSDRDTKVDFELAV